MTRYYSAALALALFASNVAAAAQPCPALTKFRLAEHRVVIQQAREVAASAPGVTPAVPAHCRVDGAIDERTGRDGKPYAIGFAVALPAKWKTESAPARVVALLDD